MRLIDADSLISELLRGINADTDRSVQTEFTKSLCMLLCKAIEIQPTIDTEPHWIPVSERLPETDGENSINSYNVLLWVREKNNPDDEPQIYIGKLLHLKGDDGSGNFWGIKINPCEWTIWGWSYFREPEVIAWMPLPKPYEVEND